MNGADVIAIIILASSDTTCRCSSQVMTSLSLLLFWREVNWVWNSSEPTGEEERSGVDDVSVVA